MTPTKVEPEAMCVPEEEATTMLDEGLAAMDYLRSELKKLAKMGMANPEYEKRVQATTKKLTAIKRKWDL